jgi:hypothetical protein
MSTPGTLYITKASGELVPFDEGKLRTSLQRAGAGPEVASTIVEQVATRISQGMSTRQLYRMAFGLLHKRSHRAAARYRLKQGILDLGPSGFPFERFIGRILEHDGYTVQVGLTVQGRCVAHEVDVVADKDSQHYLVECKYHNTPGRICDVKVPLYIQARFLDVAEQWRKHPGNGERHLQGWLVTNTRFTSDALQYGQCAGLRMVSWDHPAKGSLRDRIDRSGLYPLTCLGSLTKAEKERLLQQGLVLVRDVLEHPEALHDALVKPPRFAPVLADAEALCGPAQGTP